MKVVRANRAGLRAMADIWRVPWKWYWWLFPSLARKAINTHMAKTQKE